MANNVQQNSTVKWRYFTPTEPFIKCNICNVLYERNDIVSDINYMKKHLVQKHSHIIEEIKEEIKSTWWSRYFAFNIKCESIRCIFCEKDIGILDGVDFEEHTLHHNIHENTINYLKDEKMMRRKLSPEIYIKIIQKIQDDYTSAGLSYFIFDPVRYGYTTMKCERCEDKFNILLEKQILKEHLFLHHYIIIEDDASPNTSYQYIDVATQTSGNQGECSGFEIITESSISMSNHDSD